MHEKMIRSFGGSKGHLGYSVSEVAEELGLFPSDVEQTFKMMCSKGIVKCYMYNGQLYAIFEKCNKIDWNQIDENEPMYR